MLAKCLNIPIPKLSGPKKRKTCLLLCFDFLRFTFGIVKKKNFSGIGATNPVRSIYKVFEALSDISVALAEHGPGLMPPNVCTALETSYMQYRESYNSPFG